MHCELEYMVKKTEGVGGQGVVVKKGVNKETARTWKKIQALEVQRPSETKTIF